MYHPSTSSFLWLCVLVFSCVVAAAEPMDELSKANNAFAVDLYKIIGATNIGKNMFFSPISISTAFGMVSLGARGRTREQTKAVLRLDMLSSDETVKEAYKQLLTAFKDQANNYTLHLVNRLFGSKKFQFHDEFLQETQEYFEASLESLDFVGQPENSRRHINRWVEDQTQERIRDLLPEGSVDSETILLITNAIYFKAYWAVPFKEQLTHPAPFSISRTEPVDMDMMNMYDEFLNYHDSSELRCQVLELPYHGNKTSMFILLPHDFLGLTNLERQLTGENLVDTLSRVQRYNMEVRLPKFLIDQNISLKQFLQMMGMVDIFDPQNSDLSGIGGPDRLVLSDAIHKAFVNISESGTEAAAATAIKAKVLSLPPRPYRFEANHPFLFVIYEKNTKSVLFIGRLVRPPTAKESIGKFGEKPAQQSNAVAITTSVAGLCSAFGLLSVYCRLL